VTSYRNLFTKNIIKTRNKLQRLQITDYNKLCQHTFQKMRPEHDWLPLETFVPYE